MNNDQLINLVQKLVTLLSGYFVAKGIGDSSLWEIISAAVVGLITWYVSHQWNATPASTPVQTIAPGAGTPTSGFAVFTLMLFTALFAVLAAIFLMGCAHIQPGNDPIIVNAERAQTIAAPTFDLVLDLDNSSRALWQSKAPAFHDFCESLRRPQLAYLADGTPTNVQRVIALQLNLDKLKLDYKASKVTSNAVLEAVAALQSIQQQANAWLTVVTNPAPQITVPIEVP